MMKNRLFILIFFLATTLFAQDKITYSGKIHNDSLLGFKQIALTPALRVVANNNFSDLRVYDKEDEQVPYFIQEQGYKRVVSFVSIPHKVFFTKTATTLLIENPRRKLYNSFSLLIANAAVYKKCKIEGKDQTNRWFVISQSIPLYLNKSTKKGYHYYNVNFPSIDYSSIRVVINDSLSSPIHVKDIGYFKQEKTPENIKYIPLKYAISSEDIKKKTQIHVTATYPFKINKIDFAISKSSMFRRKGRIYYKDTLSHNERILQLFELHSKTKNSFKNLNIQQKDFWIEIDNQDNKALEFDSISFSQKEKYLVGNFVKIETYKIKAGDKKMTKPSYDLQNFMDDIDYNLPLLEINQEQIIQPKPPKKKTIAFYETKLFMWVSIAIVAAILLFFTLSLLKNTEILE